MANILSFPATIFATQHMASMRPQLLCDSWSQLLVLLCPLLSDKQRTKLEGSEALYASLYVLPAALDFLYHTGLQTHL